MTWLTFIYTCTAFSIGSGLSYTATSTDQETAINLAAVDCDNHEPPFGAPTCVDDGCVTSEANTWDQDEAVVPDEESPES